MLLLNILQYIIQLPTLTSFNTEKIDPRDLLIDMPFGFGRDKLIIHLVPVLVGTSRKYLIQSNHTIKGTEK